MRSSTQRGFALLLTLVIVIAAGVGYFFIAFPTQSSHQAERVITQGKALDDARKALVMYAATHGTSSNRAPGALICPDVSHPNAEATQSPPTGPGYQDLSPCNEEDGVAIGRLPVKNLGLDPRSASPLENIWYAMDLDLRDREGAMPINPETTLGLTLNSESGYAAVLMLPSDPTSGQNRPSAEPEDYLAAVNSGADPIFVDCSRVPDDDDICEEPGSTRTHERVIGVSTGSLFVPVQFMALEAVEEIIREHYADAGDLTLPYAAELGSEPEQRTVEGLESGLLPLLPDNPAIEACGLDEAGEEAETVDCFSVCDMVRWIRTRDEDMDVYGCDGIEGGNDWLRFVHYRMTSSCSVSGGDCTATLSFIEGFEIQGNEAFERVIDLGDTE